MSVAIPTYQCPIDDFVVVQNKDKQPQSSISLAYDKKTKEQYDVLLSVSSRAMTALRDDNERLKAENATLLVQLADQQKEIFALTKEIKEQAVQFQAVLAGINERQEKLEEEIAKTRGSSNLAMISTAVSIACAIIGGTCGFSGIYRGAIKIIGSVVPATNTAALAAAAAVTAASSQK